MTTFRIELDDRAARRAFAGLIAAMADMTPLMEGIGADIMSETDLAFRDGRSPFGIPWAPLSPVTVARRRQGSNVPLRDSGRLAASIDSAVNRNSVEVGTNLPYAPTHQFGARQGAYGRTRRGGPIPWGTIPARPFLPLPDDTGNLPPDLASLIRQRAADFINEAVAA